MYLLTCSHCQTSIPVSPAQAGDEIPCPQCGEVARVPKLGELRQLPTAGTPGVPEVGPSEVASGGRTTGFVIFGGLATLCLLIAAFCGIRWALITVPSNTELHIDQMRQAYKEAQSAQLIREWEDMEKYGVDIVSAYNYQKIANEKRRWGTDAAVAGSIAGLCILAAWGFARSGRQPESPPTL